MFTDHVMLGPLIPLGITNWMDSGLDVTCNYITGEFILQLSEEL